MRPRVTGEQTAAGAFKNCGQSDRHVEGYQNVRIASPAAAYAAIRNESVLPFSLLPWVIEAQKNRCHRQQFNGVIPKSMWAKAAAEDSVELRALPYMGFLVANLRRFYPPALKEIIEDMISANSLQWHGQCVDIDLSGYRDRVRQRIEELLATESLVERDWATGAEPCIRGTLIPVTAIVESIERGVTASEIAESYPELTEWSIRAAIVYAGAFRPSNRKRSTLEIGEPYIQLVGQQQEEEAAD